MSNGKERIAFDYPIDEPTVDLSRCRWIGPQLPGLDEAGRRIYYRACDLTARFWLNEKAIPEFDAGNFAGSAMLIHSERYLSDRLAYELAPWPKGMMKLETEEDYRLPD